jgi:hypothetical protein
MAITFNIIYNNNGLRTPSGSTPGQTVAGLTNTGVYLQNTTAVAQSAVANDPYAAAVMQSNGENIGNPQQARNPLPPGRTK